MKRHVDLFGFIRGFNESPSYQSWFTHDGLIALYSHIRLSESDHHQELEFSVVRLCGCYREYANIKDFHGRYASGLGKQIRVVGRLNEPHLGYLHNMNYEERRDVSLHDLKQSIPVIPVVPIIEPVGDPQTAEECRFIVEWNDPFISTANTYMPIDNDQKGS